MAGYSGTPLVQKLGIKDGASVAILSAPDSFALEGVPDRVTISSSLAGKKPLDVVILFTTSLADLRKRFDPVAKRLAPNGGFWVAWPKKASKMKTDVTEDLVRE